MLHEDQHIAEAEISDLGPQVECSRKGRENVMAEIDDLESNKFVVSDCNKNGVRSGSFRNMSGGA